MNSTSNFDNTTTTQEGGYNQFQAIIVSRSSPSETLLHLSEVQVWRCDERVHCCSLNYLNQNMFSKFPLNFCDHTKIKRVVIFVVEKIHVRLRAAYACWRMSPPRTYYSYAPSGAEFSSKDISVMNGNHS